jgi:hypothetical protein
MEHIMIKEKRQTGGTMMEKIGISSKMVKNTQEKEKITQVSIIFQMVNMLMDIKTESTMQKGKLPTGGMMMEKIGFISKMVRSLLV